MYTTIYTFGFHIRSVIFLLVVTIIFVISGICAFLTHRTNQKPQQERIHCLIVCAISGLITITFWWGYSADYSYYRAIYDQHTYQTVQGTIQPFPQEPRNQEIFQVGDVVFRNSPRQLTSAFTGHSQIFQLIKQGVEVRILHAGLLATG